MDQPREFRRQRVIPDAPFLHRAGLEVLDQHVGILEQLQQHLASRGLRQVERDLDGRPAGPALRAEAERLGAKRVFVTTTKSVAQSALLADVIKELGDRYAGVYAGITAHSPRPCVIEGAQMAREAKADLLVAVGGGSAIDATKVMLIALWQNATTIDDLDLYRAGRPKEGAAPPSEAIRPPADAVRMLAVPTTLSAAEFNAFAGVSDPRRGVK